MNKDKNIALIGMPGSGKTIIGKRIAGKTGMRFIDMDEYIEKEAGMAIPKIFQKGEEYFRDLESQAVLELSKAKSAVISTGGGVIKRESNMVLLKEGAFVVFIDRPIDFIINDVDIKTRPLLKGGVEKLFDLYKERYPLYIKYCHKKVYNKNNIEDVVEEIIKYLDKS